MKPFATAYRWQIDGVWTSWYVTTGDLTHAKSRAKYEEKSLYDIDADVIIERLREAIDWYGNYNPEARDTILSRADISHD